MRSVDLINTLQNLNLDTDARRSAAIALEQLGDKQAVETMIDALTDEQSYAIQDAIRILGKFGDERVVEPLINTLRHSDGNVRQTATKALGNTKLRSEAVLYKSTSKNFAKFC